MGTPNRSEGANQGWHRGCGRGPHLFPGVAGPSHGGSVRPVDYYLADPQEYEKFHNAGAHDIHCPEVVGKAARWMAEIILGENLVPQAK